MGLKLFFGRFFLTIRKLFLSSRGQCKQGAEQPFLLGALVSGQWCSLLSMGQNIMNVFGLRKILNLYKCGLSGLSPLPPGTVQWGSMAASWLHRALGIIIVGGTPGPCRSKSGPKNLPQDPHVQ